MGPSTAQSIAESINLITNTGSIQAGMAALAAGIAVLGAGLGIGLIGYSALQAMARQPEMAGQIRTTMFIAAALVEGVALFALVLTIVFKG